MHCAITLTLHLLLAVPTQTLTVGPGPGQDFTDLAQAVRASQPGDLILVAPGVYGPIDIDHAVVIVSAARDGTRFSVRQDPGRPAVTIRGLRAGASVTLRDAIVQHNDASVAAVKVNACAGAVQLHGVELSSSQNLGRAGSDAALQVSQSRSVWLRDVRVGAAGIPVDTADAAVGFAAAALDASEALLQGCALRGFDRVGLDRAAGDALRLSGQSRASIREVLLTGGDGGGVGGNGLVLVDAPRSRADFCGFGRQTGGFGSLRTGSGVVPSAPLPGACLFETAGSVRTATRWTPGTAAQVVIEAFLPRRVWLLAGLPAMGLNGLPGTLGLIAFDPATVALLGGGTLSNSARPSVTVSCSVPPGPGLIGLNLAVQALLEGVAEAPQPAWSAPALITVLG